MINKMAFIGAGSMAEAMLTGIAASDFMPKERIYVTNKSDQKRLAYLEDYYAVKQTDDAQKAVKNADIVVLAVKPHDLKEAAASIKDCLNAQQLLISVVAGVSTEVISGLLNQDIPIIRAMPNTSSAVGQSATAVTRGDFTGKEHVQTALDLFRTIGTATETDEAFMHTVTAIAGSGPAYVYYLVEAMEQEAVKTGLDYNTAHRLITQTIAGAGEMLQTSSLSPSELCESIASPGGTTQAGLDTLDEHHVQTGVRACVDKARKRSIELGKAF